MSDNDSKLTEAQMTRYCTDGFKQVRRAIRKDPHGSTKQSMPNVKPRKHTHHALYDPRTNSRWSET